LFAHLFGHFRSLFGPDGIEHTGQKGQEFVVGEAGHVSDNWKANKVTKADDAPKVVLKNVEVSQRCLLVSSAAVLLFLPPGRVTAPGFEPAPS